VSETVSGRVLIVDDDELVRRSVRRTVKREGHEVLEAGSAEEATELLQHEPVDVVLLDIHLPGRSGLELLQDLPALRPMAVAIVFTGRGDVAVANRALEMGAADYFAKPVENWARFLSVLKRSVQFARVREENAKLRTGGEGLLHGRSAPMVELRRRIEQVARSSASVLIHGESGTGKELVAREVHRLSERPGRFVAVNCAAIPESLMETELFGHVRGAHSTATDDRVGLLEAAEDGTLLLDEIGDMPLELQAKLLRVLENRTFRPVGGHREVKVTARVLAASHRDLREAVDAGSFRRDLLFRLDVVTLKVPPLRDRIGDVALLVYRFVEEFAAAEGRPVRQVSREALESLERHPWPGNVRELRNAMQRAVLMSEGDTLQVEDLPGTLQPPPPSSTAPQGDAVAFGALMGMPYQDAKEELVRTFTVAYLARLLEEEGTIKAAAERAGMARPNLSRLMKRYGVDNKG
jgi:two-component system nitrogen regulation response regulator NtrX